jgi:hypothetical protein
MPTWTLQTHVYQADVRVLEIMVVVQALHRSATQLQGFLLAVRSNLVRPATLHTLEDADQPLVDAVALGDFPSPSFLVHLTVVQVHYRTTPADGRFLGSAPYLCCDVAGEGLEILEKNLPLPQVAEHPRNIGQEPARAAEANAIEAMQDPQDIFAESLYKSLHSVASSVGRAWICRCPYSTNQKQRFLFVVAALPR